MQCSQCGSPAAVQCNGECHAFFCAEHDRVAHSISSELAHHQRTRITQTSNIAPLSGGSSSSSHDVSSNACFAPSSSAVSPAAPFAVHAAVASASDAAAAPARYVGQRDEQGRAHGLGCEVDANGRMIAERCGVWSHGLLLEGRSVPLSLMPADLFTEKRARGAARLRADGIWLRDGSWYCGEVDARYRAHGQGSWFEQFGLITVECTGRFDHGDLPSGTLRYPNGVKFDGQLQVGRPHGAGVLTHPDGRLFKGEWKEDKAVSGALQSAPTAAASASSSLKDGEEKKAETVAAVRYVGELDPLNLPHGFGYETDVAGRRIEGRCGEWIHGSFAGQAQVTLSRMPPHSSRSETLLLSADGLEYGGEVDAQGRPHGHGGWFSAGANGRLKAKGTFDHGWLSKGYCEWPNGDTYEGQRKNGKRDGEGKRVRKSDGVIIEGTWSQDAFVSGKITTANGRTLQGFFLNDALHGDACTFVLANGARYEGGMRHGQMEGVGKLTLANGHSYLGQFANDRKSGFGVERSRDGTITHCGEFKEGKLMRSCPVPLALFPTKEFTELRKRDAVLLHTFGEWYRGGLDDHQSPHGAGCWSKTMGTVTIERSSLPEHGALSSGTLRFSNGVTYIGQLKDWYPHGVGVLTHPDGRSFKGEWINGKAVSVALQSAAAASASSSVSDDEKKRDELGAAARYVGELDSLHLPYGLGHEVDPQGKMIARRCGRWIHGSLAFEGALPLSLVPQELFALERARGVTLLSSDGEEYRGELDDDHEPHGEGCLLFCDGRVKAKGTFDHGRLTKGFAEWPNGATYEGEWKDGKRHGQGKFVHKSDGVVDEGTWHDGELVSGKCTFPDGEWQQGMFIDDELHGSACIFVLANGNRHEGGMRHGKQEGVGKFTCKESGETYEGQWANNARSGFGVQRRPDQRILLCGEWAQDKFIRRTYRGPLNELNLPDGEGSLHHANGNELVRGRWINGAMFVGQRDDEGRPHGFGCEIDAGGNTAVGRCGVWNCGLLLERRAVPLSLMPAVLFTEKRAQDAVLLRANNERYRGAVDADHRPHGDGCWLSADGRVKAKGTFDHGWLVKGLFEWRHGDTYEGEWKDGKRHGQGKRVCKAGDVDEGTWRDDKFVSGKRSFTHGEVQQGIFVDGELDGPDCVVVLSSGDRYEGGMRRTMLRAKFEGIGRIEWKESAETFEGQWEDGKRHGLGVLRSCAAMLLCAEWAQDKFVKSRPVPRSALPAGSLPHADDALLFPDGRTYRGPLNSEHQPHGFGVMHRSDGAEVERGEWRDGEQAQLTTAPNASVFAAATASSISASSSSGSSRDAD